MLRFLLGMILVFSVTCFAKPTAKSDLKRCGPKEYYSFGEEECLTITSNIRLRDRCTGHSRAIGTGYIGEKRALACADQDESDAKYEDKQHMTEGSGAADEDKD
jgi:hypothetical protein